VPARRVHEELERVERSGGGGDRNFGRGGPDDHVALVEGDVERRDLLVGQLVLVGERLEVLLLDEAAVGGLLDQALGGGQIVQVRISQWNLPLSSVVGAAPLAEPEAPARGIAR